MDKKPMLNRLRVIAISLLICAIFLLIAVQLVNSLDYPNSDFFSFWLAGRMVWTGENPYDAPGWIEGHDLYDATWISDDTFLYPLPLALVFAPLGLLTLYIAFIVWLSILEVIILVSTFLLISFHQNPNRKYYIFPILAGVVLFRPTWISMTYGQNTGILLIVLVGVICLWEKDKWLPGSLLLPLLALKPNIGVPILAVISLWLLFKMRIKELVAIAASGVALILLGMLLNPRWIIDYWSIGSNKLTQTFGFSPTVWGLSALITGFEYWPTVILGGIVSAGVLVGVGLLIWRKRDSFSPPWLVSLAVTTTLLITPYTWPYDQLLLIIPLIVITMEMMERKYPFLVTATMFIFVDILAIGLLAVSAQMEKEVVNGIIPLVVFGGLVYFLLSIRVNAKSNSLLLRG